MKNEIDNSNEISYYGQFMSIEINKKNSFSTDDVINILTLNSPV